MGFIYILSMFSQVLGGIGLDLLRIGYRIPLTFVAFRTIFETCALKLRLQLMVTPRYLSESDHTIGLFWYTRWGRFVILDRH